MKISQPAVIFLSTLIGSEAANGGNGGQGGNGGGGKSTKLNCGDTIEGSVTLINSLTCDNTSGTAAITVAPGATLDCAGHSIIGRNTDSDFDACESCPTLGVGNAVAGSNAINLENGGTVTNCVVTGFHQGILVLDASANVMNTKVYNSLRDGIDISDCTAERKVVLENVDVVGNGDEGIDVGDFFGRLTLKNVNSLGNGWNEFGGGIEIRSHPDLGKSTITFENFHVSNSFGEGILIRRRNGGAVLEFYGDNVSTFNNGVGLGYQGGFTDGQVNVESDFKVYGSLKLEGNGDGGLVAGNQLGEGTFSIFPSGSLYSCGNGKYGEAAVDVIDVPADGVTIDGTLVCAGNDLCENSCSPAGETLCLRGSEWHKLTLSRINLKRYSVLRSSLQYLLYFFVRFGATSQYRTELYRTLHVAQD